MSDADDPTEPVDEVEPVEPEPAVEPAPAADPVHTVPRRSAAVGAAGALLLGVLLGWLGTRAFDDDEAVPVSAFETRGGMMPMMPMGPMGPRGHWEDRMPPWMEDDHGEYECPDRGDDRGDEQERDEED
jgi:hypothetical protein